MTDTEAKGRVLTELERQMAVEQMADAYECGHGTWLGAFADHEATLRDAIMALTAERWERLASEVRPLRGWAEDREALRRLAAIRRALEEEGDGGV